MINCDQIAVESAKLKAMFTKCYNLKAIDLRSIVDLIESVSACSGGSFNLKTVNGQSLLGIGNIVVTAVVDGTETKVQQGSGITVTGNGSISSPYVVSNSSIVTVDGSETKINQGSNITIAGTGTVANPYVINAETQSQTPQVNADWASISGVSEILNKPTIPSAQGLQEVINVGGYAELGDSNSYVEFASSVDDITDREIHMNIGDGIIYHGISVGYNSARMHSGDSANIKYSYINAENQNISLKIVDYVNETNVVFSQPLETTTLNFPAKTVAGEYTLATTDEVDAIDLQKVIDTGSYAEIISANQTGYTSLLHDYSGEEDLEFKVTIRDNTDTNNFSTIRTEYDRVEISSNNNSLGKISVIQVSGGIARITQRDGIYATNIEASNPIENTTLNFPAKTMAGDYTLATLDNIPLDKTGTGVFLRGRIAANYGTPGNRSFDVSYAFTPSTGTPYGAIGSYSFAMGNRVSSNGYGASSFGYLIDNGGIGSFNSGYNMYDRGYTNFLTGIGHNVTSMNATVVGQAANIISESILDFNTVPTKALFTVGNGTIQNADNTYTVLTRSDAFKVRLNGSVEAPSLTPDLINADVTGKILITKEYLNSSFDLQKVINVGGYAEVDGGNSFVDILSGDENDRTIRLKSGTLERSASLKIDNDETYLRADDDVSGDYAVITARPYETFFETNAGVNQQKVVLGTPLADAVIVNFPTPSTSGTYTLATTDDIPTLKQVMEQDLNDNVASGSITLYQPSLSSTEYSSESILTTEPTVGRKISISYADGSITSADLQFAFPSSKIDGNYIIATTDDLDAIDLEKIIDAGNTVLKGSSTLNLLVDDGLGGYSSEISCSNGTDYSILNISTENINIGSYNSISNLTSDYGVCQGNIGINTSNILTGHSTHIEIDGPFSVSTLRFPAPLVDGVYTIDVTPNSTYTVSTLPSGVLNDKAIVTDATAPTYLGVLVGGGSVVAPVWHNGTNWVSR